MSTSLLKALPGKLDIKSHSPSILYVSASLAMSTSLLKALPGKLDIKSHSPSILYVSASLAMSTSLLKALPGKLDIKRHSPSILFLPLVFQLFIQRDVSMSRTANSLHAETEAMLSVKERSAHAVLSQNVSQYAVLSQNVSQYAILSVKCVQSWTIKKIIKSGFATSAGWWHFSVKVFFYNPFVLKCFKLLKFIILYLFWFPPLVGHQRTVSLNASSKFDIREATM